MSTIRDIILSKIIGGSGGGGSVTVEALSVTENNTYTAPSGTAYSPVNVDVPNTYGAGDEGKVVNNGALVGQTSRNVNQNGAVDTTLNNQIVVSVPNTYAAGDEGKVVSNGELVAQTAHATVTENGTIDTTLNNSVVVDVPQGGGGGSVASNAVNFRDYDGTIVASYSAADFAALTALPTNPSHDGLTAQGWNWTLVKAKAYVAKYGKLEIGQMYITDDGKTRVYIHLEQGRTSPMLGVCPNGTVDVDWGDGTAHNTLTGTSTSIVQWTPNHAYAAPGDYVIKLTITGSMWFYGSDSSNQYSGLLRYTSGGDTRNYAYRNAIQRVEIGSSVTSISDYAFYFCYGLASVTIPNTVTSIGNSAFNGCCNLASLIIPDSVTSIGGSEFYYCYSLANVAIPDSVTSIGSSAFNSCYNLASIIIPDNITSIGLYVFNNCYNLVSVIIPDGITSIGYNAFYYCYSLASVTVPNSVTSISSNAFYNCYGVAEYHLAPTTPPTLGSTNVFNGIPADCIIYVPYSADHSILETYKSASNWSNFASKMQEEPQ